VDGNVTVAGGNVTLAGHVGGSVTVVGGDVELLPGASVGGSVDDLGGTVRRAPGSRVGGGVQQGLSPRDLQHLDELEFNGAFSFPWTHLIFWALAGAALALFYPRQLAQVRRTVGREFAASVVLGAGAWVAGSVAAVVLFVTCIGIPIALGLAAALWLGSVVGTVALGLGVGERLVGARGRSSGAPLAATVIGVSLIALVKAIPCIGAVITVVVACAGLGATLLALRDRRRRSPWRG
ncbi:MAG: hypothetical protein ACHQ4H_18535, partial [Ktedonobacterales bacterium]